MKENTNNEIMVYPNNYILIVVAIILTIIYSLFLCGVFIDNRTEGLRVFLSVIISFLIIFSMYALWFYKKNTYIQITNTKLIFAQPLHTKKEFDYQSIEKCELLFEGYGYPVIVLHLSDSANFVIKGAFLQKQLDKLPELIAYKHREAINQWIKEKK